MSKTYYVKIPFAGYVGLEVEADDEESAIEAALDKAAMTCEGRDGTEVQEWEFLEYVVQGNVCAAPLWEAEAECQGDEDGDVHPQEG
jgi:hypothetical protein